MIKKLLFSLLAVLPLCVSCYDDSFIWNELREHEVRISRLETMCLEMNANIVSLQAILEVLERNEYLTDIVAVEENGTVTGYKLTFTSGKTVTIYHGKDGKDGEDGQDGYAPVVGIAMDEDGEYYWTLDGEWMLDEKGDKISAMGKDGKDGQDGEDGKDGKDAVTPEFKVEDGYWHISFDGGKSWEKLGQATGDQGPQGKPGVGGDSMFTDVDYSSSEDYVILYLNNGMQIQIPTWSAFEALKEQCQQANANIEALQKIVEALQDNVSVVAVTPIYEGEAEVGYIISFSDGVKVTIYHGKDGSQGEPGEDGQPGEKGSTPSIGVKKDVDGLYYWTLDGEWLLDDAGNKVPTTGKDGVNGNPDEGGVPGNPGKDGVTPQLKIEENDWYVSYDNGETWEKLGPAVGDKGDSFFKDVDEDEHFVYFTLANGEKIVLPKQVSLAIEFDVDSVNGVVAMNPNSTREVRYSVTSVLPDVQVEVLWSGDVLAKVIPDQTGPSTGVIQVKVPGDNIDEYCKVVVLVSNGEKVIMKTLVVEREAIEVVEETEMEIPSEGGEVELAFMSNTVCEVAIPQEAQSWISVAPGTKALTRQTITLILEPNTLPVSRSAEVSVCGEEVSLTFTVTQDPAEVEEPEPDIEDPVDDWTTSEFYHRSVMMRFTADWCGYCPSMATAVTKAQEQLPNKIEAISVHGYDSALACSASEKLLNNYPVDGFPTGLVDGTTTILNDTSINVTTSAIISAVESTESRYDVLTGTSWTSSISGNTINMNLSTYVKKSGAYKVTTLLVEDKIISRQNGASDDYEHNGVLRAAMSDALGDSFTVSTDNTVKEFTYSATIPAGCKKENMRIVVYVQAKDGSTWYIDNSDTAKLGESKQLALVGGSQGGLDGEGNEGIVPGEDIML